MSVTTGYIGLQIATACTTSGRKDSGTKTPDSSVATASMGRVVSWAVSTVRVSPEPAAASSTSSTIPPTSPMVSQTMFCTRGSAIHRPIATVPSTSWAVLIATAGVA